MRIIGLGLFFIINLSFAEGMCKEVEKGFVVFDNKKSDFVRTERIQLLKCDDGHFEMNVENTKNHLSLDKIVLSTPKASEKWFIDGLTCNEKGSDSKRLFRNKVVLAIGLKVQEAWSVNLKTLKIEKLKAQDVSCHQEEP